MHAGQKFSQNFTYAGDAAQPFGIWAAKAVGAKGLPTPRLLPLFKCPVASDMRHAAAQPTPLPTPVPTATARQTKKETKLKKKKTTKQKIKDKATTKKKKRTVKRKASLSAPPGGFSGIQRHVAPTEARKTTQKKRSKSPTKKLIKRTTKKTQHTSTSMTKITSSAQAAHRRRPLQEDSQQQQPHSQQHSPPEVDCEHKFRLQSNCGQQSHNDTDMSGLGELLNTAGDADGHQLGGESISAGHGSSGRGLQAVDVASTAYTFATSGHSCKALLPKGGSPLLIGYISKARVGHLSADGVALGLCDFA